MSNITVLESDHSQLVLRLLEKYLLHIETTEAQLAKLTSSKDH